MFSSMRARIDKCFSVIYFAESKQTITRSACSRKSARRTMLLENLRQQVLEANLELVRRGLVLYTFGNASGISRPDKLVVIKPSGVPYENLKPEHMVITDMEGKIVEGDLRPSSDLPTHIVIYKAFANTGGVAHTHSEFAVSWAQAG